MSHYRVLGVPQGAARTEIRAAYVSAARGAHPDLHRSGDRTARQDAADRMCAVNEAWRVLGDPARRRLYDAHRIAVAAGAGGVASARSRGTDVRGSDTPRPHEPVAPQRPERVPGRAPDGGRGNPIVLVPAALMALSVAQLVLGLLLAVPVLLTTGAVTFAASVTAFAAAPLLIMATSRSDRRSVVG